jgi:hypothetical protein
LLTRRHGHKQNERDASKWDAIRHNKLLSINEMR